MGRPTSAVARPHWRRPSAGARIPRGGDNPIIPLPPLAAASRPAPPSGREFVAGHVGGPIKTLPNARRAVTGGRAGRRSAPSWGLGSGYQSWGPSYAGWRRSRMSAPAALFRELAPHGDTGDNRAPLSSQLPGRLSIVGDATNMLRRRASATAPGVSPGGLPVCFVALPG